eukprot:3952077-Karenia_brevis.AAC.1
MLNLMLLATRCIKAPRRYHMAEMRLAHLTMLSPRPLANRCIRAPRRYYMAVMATCPLDHAEP